MTIPVEDIAMICHEVNRVYCASIDDPPKWSWEYSSNYMKKRVTSGVSFALKNPKVTSAQLHNNWVAEQHEDGWRFGGELDYEKKTHPNLVPYSRLPKSQQVKDQLFRSVIALLSKV